MKRVIIAVAMILASSSCGGEPSASDRLATASSSIHDIRSGDLSLGMQMRSGQADGSVGFEVRGPFSFAGGTALPVADLMFIQHLGPRDREARFVSDGTRAYAVTGDRTVELTQQQLGDLTGFVDEHGDVGGLPGVDLTAWITEPEVQGQGSVAGDPTVVISGPVDVAAAVTGLFTLIATMGAPSSITSLDDRQRSALEGAARSATMAVEVGEDDDLLRRLSLQVGFGVDPSLAPALSGLTDAQLDFEMTIADPGEPVTVTAPV